MTYDYFTINFTSVSGFLFLLIFLYANASLDRKIKRIFYLMIVVEFFEMLTYSLELWTTTFETLSPLRLWLSAIGYSIRPVIFCLMLMLALRNTNSFHFPKVYCLPAIINAAAAFSVFFTDIVYSYTPDNQFHRGPLGYFTHVVVIFYLILLMIIVTRHHTDRSKLEVLIIFAISLLLLFSMTIEALYSIRTIGRSTIIMVTIFYYMFFQTQVHRASITEEQLLRLRLEQTNRMDGSTGVLNKKAFADAAEHLLHPQNDQRPSRLGFLFLDLDHLKEVNDNLGHAMGDMAILDVAEALQTVFRKTDLIGRFGGDEFYVLLPDIPQHRFQICLKELQHILQKEYAADSTSVTVTASMGAIYTENTANLSFEQLVYKADEALYEAKAAGRNCCIMKELY